MRRQEIVLLVVILVVVLVCLYFIRKWNKKFHKTIDRTASDVFSDTIIIEELPQHHISTEPNVDAPEDQFRAFNPSITKINGDLLYSFRVSNYIACPSKSGKPKRDFNLTIGDKVKSFIMLSVGSDNALYINSPEFAYSKCVTGFEDPRIIGSPDGKNLMIVSNVHSNASCFAEMHLTTIPIEDINAAFESKNKPKLVNVTESQIVRLYKSDSSTPTNHEKNWMPFFDNNDLMFVYSVNPHVILKCNTKTGACMKIAETENPNVNSKLRGSSQARLYNGSYVAVAHWRTSTSSYLSQAYTFEAKYPYRITAISPTFIIKAEGTKARSLIQFVSGFEIHDDIGYVTYGEEDCDSKLFKVSMSALLKSMTSVLD
jgi:predicted GH43/DUF377 family glycosyl hydrolase